VGRWRKDAQHQRGSLFAQTRYINPDFVRPSISSAELGAFPKPMLRRFHKLIMPTAKDNSESYWVLVALLCATLNQASADAPRRDSSGYFENLDLFGDAAE
jgi:hypothetical protein